LAARPLWRLLPVQPETDHTLFRRVRGQPGRPRRELEQGRTLVLRERLDDTPEDCRFVRGDLDLCEPAEEPDVDLALAAGAEIEGDAREPCRRIETEVLPQARPGLWSIPPVAGYEALPERTIIREA
jgi:hypothetical protein